MINPIALVVVLGGFLIIWFYGFIEIWSKYDYKIRWFLLYGWLIDSIVALFIF